MSAVRTRNLAAEPNPAHDVRAMQDVLYDILATGIDPEQSQASTADIERFLFEHARSPKTAAEFCAFFARNGLSLRAPKVQPSVSLSLPPLPRATEDDAAPMPVELATRRAPTDPFEASLPSLATPAPTLERRRPVALWVALGALGALLGLAAWQGHQTITELRGELDRTAARGAQDRAALQSLHDQTVGLESSVAATGELVERMDQKSDLLIDSLVTNNKKPSRR
jgi:hypothetical protein